VKQLGFAGELPLNFGAGLADFLGFSTSWSFGMAGILDTGLTFGIDLNPDTVVQVLPPVFAPNTVQATVQTDGNSTTDPGTDADEVVRVRIVEAVGDTYQLAFRSTEGTGAFTLIGAPITVNANLSLLDNDLQAALTAALGAANDPVVTADPADPRLLTVTFNATSGTNHFKDLELIGIREAGILSATANFNVSLYNLPAIGIETVTDGDNDPVLINEVQKVTLLNATGGTFKLSFGGEETAPIAFGAAGGAVVTALEALGTIGGGDVSVTKSGNVYTVTFQGGLASTNVVPLTANAKGLVNATPLGTLVVSVARDTTNTSPKDLALDVQRAIDQKLYDQGLSIGFNPMDAAFPGTHTTGVIDAGVTTYVADAAPFTALGGTLPADLSISAVLPLAFSVTPVANGDGAPGGIDETQQVFIDAGSGTFKLSLQDAAINGGVKQTTPDLSYNASGAQIKAALEAFAGIGPNSVTVTQTVSDTDGDGVNEFTSSIVFTNPTANLATMTIDGSKLLATKFSGRLRKASVEANGIASELEDLVNGLLFDTDVRITVTTSSGKLQIEASGGDVEIRVDSPIKASAGGGRISLDAPLAKTTFSTLEPAIEVQRRIEISVGYNNPAFQEMAIASSPTRFDGRITDDIDLTLKVNGRDVHLSLLDGVTSANTSLDQLVGQLQTALDAVLVVTPKPGGGNFAAGDVIVKRVTVDPDDPSSPRGNRIVFEGKAGVVTELSIFVPDSATNGAITELGFPAGQSDTKRSKAGSFFLEDVSFGGNFGMFENNVAATASLGLLAVKADMTGTLDLTTGKFFGADVSFDLINPVTGADRITVDQIINAINDKKFFFQAGEAGGTIDDPATGFVDGVVAGGLGLTLALKPDGAIAGLGNVFGDLGSVAISAESPNWLIAPPSLSNPFGFAKLNQSLADPGHTVSAGLPSSGVLTQDMFFVLSQTIDSLAFATPVVVRAADTAGNLTGADLQADIQAAVDKAVARIQHLADQAASPGTAGTADSIEVTVTGGNVKFKSLDDHDATAENLRGLFVGIDFNKPAGLEDLLDSLKDLSFDDILAVLQMVVGMLQNLDGSSDGSPLADVFDFKIPVIDRSIGDLVDLSGDFLDFVQNLVADPSGSLQALELQLRSLLGLPPIVVPSDSILSFDTTDKILGFDFGFSSSANLVRPFNLDLADANLGIFSQLVGLSASGNLGVQAAIDLNLKLGLDLAGSDKSFFIDVNETSLTASASAFGNNLEFEASLGPVGVFVVGGSASIGGTFAVDLVDAGASSSDDRLVLIAFDGGSVTTDLGDLLDFLDTGITGTVEVVLPMFYGLESSPAPMGDAAVNSLRTIASNDHQQVVILLAIKYSLALDFSMCVGNPGILGEYVLNSLTVGL